ncbi:hypothetical protein JAAARDRAFT_104191, partial [Jaapia argillacea MUCL 33604]
STALTVTVAHAITYLTHSLIFTYPASTIIKLQLALEANLSAHFAPTWVPSEPLRGSGRRCLTLSPNCIPPRPIYAACIAAAVEWTQWMKVLGNVEMDLFVDPGCVSVRYGGWGQNDNKLNVIWSDEVALREYDAKRALDEIKLQAQVRAQAAARVTAVLGAKHRIYQESPKTLAQQLLEEDQEEDDQLFALIADEVREPIWMTPTLDQFPAPSRQANTSPATSSHSRSSSRSSSSDFSLASFDSTSSNSSFATTVSSTPSALEKQESGQPKLLSRRERARQARVFIDNNKKEVTSYEGGRTTVLTGGVMLGG